MKLHDSRKRTYSKPRFSMFAGNYTKQVNTKPFRKPQNFFPAIYVHHPFRAISSSLFGSDDSESCPSPGSPSITAVKGTFQKLLVTKPEDRPLAFAAVDHRKATRQALKLASAAHPSCRRYSQGTTAVNNFVGYLRRSSRSTSGPGLGHL